MLSLSTNTTPKANFTMQNFLTPKSTLNNLTPRDDEMKRDLGDLFPFRFPSHRVNYETLSPKKTKIHAKNIFVEAASTHLKSRVFSFSNLDKKETIPIDHVDDELRLQMMEENALRRDQMILALKDFLPLKVDPNEMTYNQRKMQTVLRENVIQLAEKITGLYNISCIYTTFPRIDSILKLDTMNDRDGLAHCFKSIIPELIKFPYSFLKKICLLSLTFTNSILIFKPQEVNSINKKVFRGIFPISKLPTVKDRVMHFYKVLFYLIKTFFPNFDKEWQKLAPLEVDDLLIGMFNVVKSSRNYFQEQVEAFYEFIQNPIIFTYSGDRKKENIGLRFKEILENLDPIGINDDWWKEMNNYSRTAFDLASKDDKLKSLETEGSTDRRRKRGNTKKLEPKKV
jgi:hypothetical protein